MLFAFLAAWLVLLKVPHVVLAWGVGTWWSAGKMAVMVAAAWGRLAAVLSVVEVGVFTLVVWVPVVMTGPNAYQWQEFVTSVAITCAGGWMVADSFGRWSAPGPNRND